MHQTLDLGRFLGKVPVMVVFLRGLADLPEQVAQLDDAHTCAGQERLQLLAVVDRPIGDLLELAAGRSVPMIADPEHLLSDSYGVVQQESSVTIVSIDVDGMVTDVYVVETGGEMAARLGELIPVTAS